MSCTNNSTISGLIVSNISNNITNSILSSGKRISFQQNVNTNWDSAISAGDVIRYDVDAGQFKKSIANPNYDSNGLSNAEVVGVVESISLLDDGITYATVVTYGLMNYPGLTATIAGISANSGGAGGTDIFFLSATVPGGITFEITEGSGYIAKPVLQLCPVSDQSYNSIVINYLGYQTSDSADFTVATSESTIGELRIISSTARVPDYWIDTSTQQFLSISEYPELYQIFGPSSTRRRQKLTVDVASGFLTTLNTTIQTRAVRVKRITGGLPAGTFWNIISVDVNNSTITVEGDNTSFLWTAQFQTYSLVADPDENGDTTVAGIDQIIVTYGELTEFRTPSITTNIQVNYNGNTVNNAVKIILRGKEDTRVSYTPDVVEFKDVQITGILGTQNTIDVDAKLVELETRIAAIEARF